MDNPDNGNHPSIEKDAELVPELVVGSRRKTKRAADFNIHVGRQIRERRKQMRWSQEKLGNMVHRTFQQMQKYENGTNQISAALLLEISEVLHVPITYFFTDASQPSPNVSVLDTGPLGSGDADKPVSDEFWRSVAKVIEYGRSNPIIQASLRSALC